MAVVQVGSDALTGQMWLEAFPTEVADEIEDAVFHHTLLLGGNGSGVSEPTHFLGKMLHKRDADLVTGVGHTHRLVQAGRNRNVTDG